MWYFTEVADWFEKNRSETDEILDQWVENSNYGTGAMVAASTTKAFTTFGAGFVDLLRLGDGVKEGSLKGVGADALRFVAVFPVGKAASMIKSAKGVAVAKLIADTGGPNCFWIASAKALRHVGQKFKGRLFIGVDDLAVALKMPQNALWVIPNLATGMSHLRRLGARTGAIKKVTSAKDIAKILPKDGSVVMVAVHVMKNGKVVAGHAIYAFRNAFGQVRFMDRTVGRALQSGTQGIYKSIEELAPVYGASAIVPYEASVLYNVFTKTVLHETPRLVIPVLGVMAEEK
jgi:hypothetical protein